MNTHEEIWKFIKDNELKGELEYKVKNELWGKRRVATISSTDLFGNKVGSLEIKLVEDCNKTCDDGVYQEDRVFSINGCLFIYRHFWDSWESSGYDNEFCIAKLENVPTFVAYDLP